MNHSVLRVVIKLVNVLIALALVAALGIVYWFVWRPLPQRSGTINAGVSARVSVSFDERGVPHIRAANLEDALFTQGYVTAQDRLWQMDALRRYSGGDLAEILGPSALETDEESRRLRLRRIAENAYVTLPAADRAAAAAYARGVNAFISTHLDNLPLEFTLLQYQPRPWSVVDTLLICLHMFRDLTSNWKTELIKRKMSEGGDADKVNFLFPIRAGGDVQVGSNAWVVSGAHTASGKPLLSNDPHLAYSLPGIWYMTHLEAPGLDVSGVALPGAPGIMIGHNQRIAWGITNLGFDVQDLYIEQIDERTGRYMYQGQPAQARAEREIIRVKGSKPVEMQLWVTRHGPVMVQDGGARMAMRWTASEPGVLQYPILDINRAQNWTDFNAAAGAISRAGLELRICGCRWKHRISCGGRLADSPGLFWKRSVGRRIGQVRMGWLHSLRPTSIRVEPAKRRHRDGEPESVSRGLRVWSGWTLRASIPRAADSRPVNGAPRVARGGHDRGAEGCLFRV